MENYKNIIDSIKDFSFDVIGYLLPGMIIVGYILFSINPKLISELNTSLINERLGPTFHFIISYILGYVAMGLSLLKIKIFTKCNYQSVIENKIQKTSLFKDALNHYKKENKIENELNVRELRTLVMSFIPETDNKIYSFRFRSDLCENILTPLICLSISFLIISIFQMNSNLFIVNIGSIFIGMHLIILIVICGLLILVRDRFYDITLRIPFSIYLSKKVINA